MDLWTHMDTDGRKWTNGHGQMDLWTHMDTDGRKWTNGHGQMELWTHMDAYGRKWTNGHGHYEQQWTDGRNDKIKHYEHSSVLLSTCPSVSIRVYKSICP